MHRMVDGKRVELTKKEIAERKAEEAIFLAEQNEYNRLYGHVEPRKMEYPPIGDQLDIIIKQLAKVRTKTPEFKELLEQVAAIKAKHPKKV